MVKHHWPGREGDCKVHQVDAHLPRSWATEEHFNNGLVDWAAEIKLSQVELGWQHKGELFLA